MNSEKILEFTRKVTISNRSELVVIMYEILFTYLEDAKNAKVIDEREEFKNAIRLADKVIVELEDSLNFSYELASSLYSLYAYSREQLASAIMKYNLEGVENATRVLNRLYKAFCEVSLQDTSKPLMENAQQIVAGMTYGKYQINEELNTSDNLRGFYV